MLTTNKPTGPCDARAPLRNGILALLTVASLAAASANCSQPSTAKASPDAPKETAEPTSTGGGAGGEASTGGKPGTGGEAGTGGKSGAGGEAGTGGKSGTAGRSGTGGYGAGGKSAMGGTVDAGATIGTGGARAGGSTGAGGGAGGKDGGVGSTVPVPFQPVVQDLCEAARACCAKAGISTTALADCEGTFMSRQTGTALVDMGQATVDATALAACEAAYQKAATACDLKQVYDSCRNILVGLQNEGQPCGRGGLKNMYGAPACKQTDGPMICLWTGDSNDPNVTGTCTKVVRGKLGDACLNTCESGASNCASDLFTRPGDTNVTLCFEDDGLYCAWSTTPSRCTAMVPAGKSCTDDSQACGSKGYCDGNSCKLRSTLGQSCATVPCASALVCNDSLVCAEYNPPYADADFTCKGYAPSLY